MSVFRARRHFGVAELLSVLGSTDHPVGRSLTESSSAVRSGAGASAGLETCTAGRVVVVFFGALLLGALVPHAATSMTSDPAMTEDDHVTTASPGRNLSNPKQCVPCPE